MSLSAPSSENSRGWDLIPLTPEYIEAEHSGYVAALESALKDSQIRNIALSGNYGVGKSSILRELAKRLDGRVVELSLSTLAPIEKTRLDEAVPLQAATPTNRIQQEIVKQLLYREDPSKTPASRFRRIERFRWPRESGIAALSGLAVGIVFLLTGWTAQIAAALGAPAELGAWTHLIACGASAAAVLLVRWLSYGRLHIKQLSAGAATVTLDENAVSYFDQYLDEIVYFFESSGLDVALFEDIDRFNNSHIFETLRALNTLLNTSPQIKRPVRFIYAIKDSIFDRIGLETQGRDSEMGAPTVADLAQADAVRANRTKFFDIVVPVVPFITHRSARNLAVRLLGKIDHSVAPELLDLATQYTPDMRLLKNVRNEFIVFRDRVFSGTGKKLGLSETDLFAMMLYKSTHLTDFEKIRIGKSNLDALYELSRELVSDNIKQVESEHRQLRHRLGRIDGVASRSTQLGERFVAHVQRTVQAAGFHRHNETYMFDGQAKSVDDLKGVQFWTDFISADGDPVLQWRNNYGQSLSYNRTHVAALLRDTLDLESWTKSDRDALTDQLDQRAEDIKFLRAADLGDLVKRPEFLVAREGTSQPLASVAQELLNHGLAYQLVRAGYINRNFTLYTSTFHGDRVSAAATNFIIHHVDRDLMDEHFELEPDDVDAVVRERGKSALGEPALYNIAILDRLLATDVDAADIMIRSLVVLGEIQEQFMQSYLTAGERRIEFVGRLTAVSARVLIYLLNQVDLDEASRRELVDAALTTLSSPQRTDAKVIKYLRTHYAGFSVLTSDATTSGQAERVADLFAVASITLPALKPLGAGVRPSFVSRNLYEITYENLTIAIKNTDTVALDAIRAANRTVYDYALRHIGAYLDAVEGSSASVDRPEQFIIVLEDLIDQGAPRLSDLVGRGAPECRVTDLDCVVEEAWPALAQHRRFPVTFRNVSRYASTLGVDEYLTTMLIDAGKIADVESAEEQAKTALASTILAARDHLASATLRVDLVVSLGLSSHLSIVDIAVETGNLFALLVKHNIIADDAEAYARLGSTDWSTREAFIHESHAFADYMTPGLVREDLALLLASDKIRDAIKEVVVEEAATYAEGADPGALNELARFATRNGHNLSPSVAQAMAQGGVAAPQVIALLEPHINVISRDQLLTILSALGGEYIKLAAVGYDRPEIPNTPANHALLERLKKLGIVNSYADSGSSIKVNKKHK